VTLPVRVEAERQHAAALQDQLPAGTALPEQGKSCSSVYLVAEAPLFSPCDQRSGCRPQSLGGSTNGACSGPVYHTALQLRTSLTESAVSFGLKPHIPCWPKK